MYYNVNSGFPFFARLLIIFHISKIPCNEHVLFHNEKNVTFFYYPLALA